jgi:hypothetical protein
MTPPAKLEGDGASTGHVPKAEGGTPPDACFACCLLWLGTVLSFARPPKCYLQFIDLPFNNLNEIFAAIGLNLQIINT